MSKGLKGPERPGPEVSGPDCAPSVQYKCSSRFINIQTVTNVKKTEFHPTDPQGQNFGCYNLTLHTIGYYSYSRSS